MAEEYIFGDDDRPDDLFGGPPEEDEPARRGEGSLDVKEVTVAGVYEHRDQANSQPVAFFVLLRDALGRSVVIWIGRFEAASISLALEGATADRPLPHDLLNSIIGRMGGTIEQILIDDLWNNTYYAKISIVADSKTIDIDSRPSDAIALALRAKSPIYMAESVLERAAVTEEE